MTGIFLIIYQLLAIKKVFYIFHFLNTISVFFGSKISPKWHAFSDGLVLFLEFVVSLKGPLFVDVIRYDNNKGALAPWTLGPYT